MTGYERRHTKANDGKKKQRFGAVSLIPLFYRILPFFAFFIGALCTVGDLNAEPDALQVFSATDTTSGELPDGWIQVLPKKQTAYTNYIITRDSTDAYLGIRSGGTGSYLEKELHNVDINRTPIMEWSWRVVRFPDVEWEQQRTQDDFAIRIELIFDFRGSKFNILNLIRKGLITTLLKGDPPVLTISYVWAAKVPAGRPYTSPSDKRTVVLPIESGTNIRNIWIDEHRNILEDIKRHTREKRLVLKKVRIRSDTDDSLSGAESGLKRIVLIAAE